jgi:hypothetical protein
MNESSISVAYNGAAPADERRDAQTELQKSTMPRALSDLIPSSEVQPVIDYIHQQIEEEQFRKALQKPNIIPFPSKAVKDGDPGMQSVWLDDLQITAMGEWYEKPSAFNFDSSRAMVDQTPILNAVIMTRIRQVQRFCRVPEMGRGPGFQIRTKDPEQKVGEDQKRSILLLQDFFQNCGWETKPRQRMRLKRDDFASFMAKLVRDTLTMDSMPIETEFKRDKALGLDGMYAVDGATIRLCTEDGYQGDDEIFALQVVQGRIRTAYTYDDLIYVPRNPSSNVLTGGYGIGETELLIRVVTGFLNAFTYNTKYFDSNSIPKGILNLYGNYTEQDVQAFKRYWNAMVKGINNAWALPVMVSKDQESGAKFDAFGVDVNEIMFAKWMTFLTSIICAIYGIAPDEINFESFTAGTSSLSGSDTEEKLANSKDKGLRPLLSYFENLFTDFVVQEFSDQYVFRFSGLDAEDEDKRHEMRKLVLSVDEIRAQEGYDKWPDGSIGGAPVNPSLLGAWQAEQQQQNQDFGQPGQEQPGAPGGDDKGGKDGEDFGEPGGENDTGADFGKAPGPDDDEDGGVDDGTGDNEDMSKAFGMPIFRIEA